MTDIDEMAEALDNLMLHKAAAMLRAQHEAIRVLREALNAMVYEGHWSADEKAKAALAATEDVCKN